MRIRLWWCSGVLSLLAVSASAQSARFEVRRVPADARWFKGNTHTHTTESDGDTAPAEVAQWYKRHGYQPHGAVFEEAGMPHLEMKRVL